MGNKGTADNHDSRKFASLAANRLARMDRTEELCLVTAALCAFGTALVAQVRQRS